MDAERWRRAADLFDAALERSDSERRAFLAQACTGDDGLLAEVEALIAEDRRVSILDTPIDAATLDRLAPLRQVGPYALEGFLGAGGMGEVFRGRDARLGRDVAVKILPAVLATDSERLARFKREAQVLASLNHPNIAAIYGVESDGRTEALILELVDGPTLADRIAAGPIAAPEALAIALQLADALAAAHEAGVIHRDLKPANVKVRDDGVVKVLDFGLARVASGRHDLAAPALASPTITTPAMRAAGLLLGTAAYMSPEQARGKAVDHRSDVWAFGCVLFEMLSGVRPFPGQDVGDTLAAVLQSDPDWSRLPGDTPKPLASVVRRCLEKDPARRYHAIADARLDLTTPIEPAVATPPARAVWGERVAWGALTTALAASFVFAISRPALLPDGRQVRFEIAPPADGAYGSIGGIAGGLSGATVSPDGARLAFVGTDASGRTSLWLRPLNSNAAHSLPGTEGASLPFWSPDSRSIGFLAVDRIKAADVATGAVREIAAAPLGRGGTWGSQGVIVFTRGMPSELVRVSEQGGPVTPIPIDGEPSSVTRQPLWPRFLPDDRHFVYWARVQSFGEPGLAVASIEPGHAPRTLVASDSAAVVLPSGTLLFARGDHLLQQRFDLARLELSGEATRVDEPVLINQGAGFADISVSATGTLVYQPSTGASNRFTWVDRTGRPLQTVGQPGRYRSLALSPDGRRLAFENTAQGDLWILDLERGAESRFTSDGAYEACPVWFPDGSKIAYRSFAGGVFEKDVDGTSAPRQLMEGYINGPSQVTGDGRWLLYFQVPPGGRSQDVLALPLAGDAGPPRTVVSSPFADVEPSISPDGRWLAYASTESGRNEIYVQPFPPTGARWQVSSAGGRQPVWRADGRELFFVADDRRFYGVAVASTAGRFTYGVPQFLFDLQANVYNVRNSFAPSADGQRFLVNTLLDSRSPLTVVLNWRPR